MGSNQSSEGKNIPLDFYKEDRIIGWHIELALINDWLLSLDEKTQMLVLAALDVLSQEGPNLKRPLVGSIEGSKFKNMKELRPGSWKQSEIRILFAFDPERHAIMLLAGDKCAQWDRWYKRAIPEADKLFRNIWMHWRERIDDHVHP